MSPYRPRATNNPVPLRDLFLFTQTPSLSASWQNMKQEAKEVIFFTLAIAQFQRGAVGNAEIATELALADTAIRTLNGRRQTAIYDVIRWMARSSILLYADHLSPDDIVDVSGVDEEAAPIDLAAIGAEPLPPGASGDDVPDEFEYRAIPYSATENSRIIQAKSMDESLPVIQMGMGLVIIFPLVLGILGFLVGVIQALIYNVVASMVGGIEIVTDQRYADD